MIRALRRLAGDALDRRFGGVHDHLNELANRVAAVEGAAAERDAALAAALATLSEQVADVGPTLRILAGNDSGNRRLLAAARATGDYAFAFDEPRPLVTVIVPTFDRAELLAERMLPSILAQSHEALEVLVVGDGPAGDAADAVAAAGDSRVRYTELSQRYVYPDPHRHWLAASTLARNDGYRLATGRWLFDVDDDDSLPPDAIERLLGVARERQLEAVQGRIREHRPDGTTELIAPTVEQLPMKGALVHAHLRFFERDHVASALAIPGDWFRGERMVRAGVRIGFVDDVTYEYFPSSLWRSSTI